VILDPPEARQQYELHVRELVLRERRPDLSLPGQRDAPEQEAGALLWRVVY